MKAALLISNRIHSIINDLEDKINKGVKRRAIIKLAAIFKYWVIYKKRVYQWGMSPLALLAYLIYIVNIKENCKFSIGSFPLIILSIAFGV